MIILTGGKTGGHITPLISIADNYKDCVYVGQKGGLEDKICRINNVKFIGLDIKRNIYSLIKKSFDIKFKNIKCIISTGGYISIPVILYGIRNNIPIYFLEGNVILGRTIKFFKPFSKKIFSSYPIYKLDKKMIVSGMPITKNDNIVWDFEFDILIVGGGLGSKPLCDLVFSLNDNYRIVLVAGKYFDNYQNINNVRVLQYCNNLYGLMKKAKIIVCRAGAMTSYEIFSIGKPCIIIPSLKTTNNHQVKNAKYFESKGACIYLDELESSIKIKKYVDDLIHSKYKSEKMIDCQKELYINNSYEIIYKEINHGFC